MTNRSPIARADVSRLRGPTPQTRQFLIMLQAAFVFFLALIIWSAPPLAADPLILSCEFIDGSQGGRRAAGVNQVAIDREVPSIEFRAAETIGTENPVNYSFVNARSTMINPQGDTLVIQRHPLAIAAGGVRFGSPFAIRFNETNQTLSGSISMETSQSSRDSSAGIEA